MTNITAAQYRKLCKATEVLKSFGIAVPASLNQKLVKIKLKPKTIKAIERLLKTNRRVIVSTNGKPGHFSVMSYQGFLNRSEVGKRTVANARKHNKKHLKHAKMGKREQHKAYVSKVHASLLQSVSAPTSQPVTSS